MNHLINNDNSNTCKECGEPGTELRNYDMMWRDGDVYCKNGHYVRMYDAG